MNKKGTAEVVPLAVFRDATDSGFAPSWEEEESEEDEQQQNSGEVKLSFTVEANVCEAVRASVGRSPEDRDRRQILLRSYALGRKLSVSQGAEEAKAAKAAKDMHVWPVDST
eukprot:g9168.t1